MNSYSAAAIAWLQQILQERFGVNLRLVILEEHTRIQMPSSSREILIRRTFKFPLLGVQESGCGKWQAELEGYKSPLCSPILMPLTKDVPSPVVEMLEENVWRINFDLIGLTYWMLSRMEEVGRSDIDSHGRFPATSSDAYKNGYLDRPIVDEWLLILAQVMKRVWPDMALKEHFFEIKVSHDVDRIAAYSHCSLAKFTKESLSRLIRKSDISVLWNALPSRLGSSQYLSSRDPYNTFEWIMDNSEKHNLKSAFYFICGRTDASKDATYEIEQPAVRALLRRIHERGHEIGLHPSYDTYLSEARVAAEAQRLRIVCMEEGIEQQEWGGRMHFLRWKSPITLYGWEGAGFDYDSTLGYADIPGFRCGTCFEYPAFDPVAQRQLRIRIRPLIVMESTVFAKRYLGLGLTDEAFDYFKKLIEASRAVNGVCTLLWHNNHFDTRGARDLYEKIIHS